MSGGRQALGRWGEDLASNYLASRGFAILDRNVRTPYGELDLVAMDGDVIVFIEVKARRSRAFGWPEEAVTSRKREKLRAAAGIYMQDHPALDGICRFDVIAVDASQGRPDPAIVHFEGAFE